MPRYYNAEAARLVHISKERVKRWLEGYVYDYADERRRQKPVIRKRSQDPIYPTHASFIDLVDLLFVKQFLDMGISLQKLRSALKEAKEILGKDHFAHESFFTDGSNICLMVKDQGEAIRELLSGGQWVISEIIQQMARRIDFDETTKIARRWFPNEGEGLVVLDPRYSFGRPIIEKKGITTENIFDLYVAENENLQAVCEWMDLTPKETEAAIRFEKSLAV